MKETFEEIGVVVEYKGKFWGVQYSDGSCTDENWGKINKAEISDPEFCTKPTDVTWTPSETQYNPRYEKLKKGRLVKIRKTTTYSTEEV